MRHALMLALLAPLALAAQTPNMDAARQKKGRALDKSLDSVAFEERFLEFDPLELKLERDGAKWEMATAKFRMPKLVADEKDARRLISLLRAHDVRKAARVGQSDPPFIYFLDAEGEVPLEKGQHLLIPIDPSRWQVRQHLGSYHLMTDQLPIYNFHDDADSARMALHVVQKYKVSMLSVLGEPTQLLFPLRAASNRPAPLDVLEGDKARADRRNPAAELLAKANATHLALPEVGLVGKRVMFDRPAMTVSRETNGTKLAVGDWTLGSFSDANAAELVKYFLRDQRLTEVVKIGNSEYVLGLSDGRPLVGSPLNSLPVRFEPGRVEVYGFGKTFSVKEGGRVLAEFADEDEARRLAAVIKAYDITQMTRLGKGGHDGVTLLGRTR